MESTKTKIVLKRLGSVNNTTSLEYAWTEKSGQLKAFTEDLQAITQEEFTKNTKQVKKIRFHQGEHKKEFMLDLATEYDRNHLAILSSHPIVKTTVTEKSGYKNFHFELIDANKGIVDQMKKIGKDNKIANYIDSLSTEGWVKIMNYLQVSTAGLTSEEIYSRLLDRKNGIAFDNYDKIMGMEQDETMPIKVALNKAMQAGVVLVREEVYYLNEIVLGGNYDQAIAYLVSNKQVYENALLPAITEIDMPISLSNELNVTKAEKVVSEMKQAELWKKELENSSEGNLKELAKTLGIAGYGTTGKNLLIKKILDKKLEIAENEEKNK